MRKILLLTFVMLFGFALAHADDKKEKNSREMFEEIQKFKAKYLAEEMDLPSAERQKFIDLYLEMSNRRRDCMKEARHLKHKLKKMENPSEADYKKVTEARDKAKIEDAAIEKEYAGKFASFLSQKQIFKMKEAEESFRKKMEEMKVKREKGKEKK